MTQPIDPCIPFIPGELPESIIINGGVIVIPEDDGDDIIIPRLPRVPAPPDVPADEIPPGGGGGGGGGGGDGDGGDGGDDDDDDPPQPVRWKCEVISTQGFGGTVTTRRCVSGTEGPFGTKLECELECVYSSQEEEPVSEAPEDNQYEPYPPSELDDVLIDEGYYPLPSDSNVFDPTINSISNVDVLNTTIDSSIYGLTAQPTTDISKINRYLSRLRQGHVKNSIKLEIRDILYNLYLPDGRRASESTISKSLNVRAINNTLGKINLRYILSLSIRAALAQITTSARLVNKVMTSTYGKSVQEIINSRLGNIITARNAIRNVNQNIVPDIDRAINRVEVKKIALDPNHYSSTQEAELLKLWYILPEDIYTKAPVIDTFGNSVNIKIPNSELFPVSTSSYQTTSIPVKELGYDVCVITESGVKEVPPATEIERAYTLNNNTEQACLFDANSKYNVTLIVSSLAASNLEFTYDFYASRPTHYVLFIDKTSIQDIPFDASPFVKRTRANYKIETNEAAIQSGIEFRAFPWMTLPIDHDDPILGHFHPSSTYSLEFTTFNLEEFGDDLTGPILVRKVPKCIIILPTDRYDYLFYSGYSSLVDWNVRKLSFTLSPDPNFYNKPLKDHPFVNLNLAYPNPDITGEYSEHGMRGSFYSSATVLSDTFQSGTEPDRTEHGFRAALRIASSLNFNYNVNEGILWTDVYKRLTATQYANIKMGVPNYMLDKLRLGEKTGVRLFHNKSGSYSVNTRLISLKSEKTDTLPVYLEVGNG